MIDAAPLHNVFALGGNVFSGSSPDGPHAFAVLKKLGVKTIISVDGAQPDIDRARKHGMRYVHLPHGYHGISRELQLQLAKAGEVLPRPIYVHCHRGKHRGPAAAAILCMANHGWTAAEAGAWMLAAGTATNYAGLYESIRQFCRPTEDVMRAVPPEFPEAAKLSDLADSMVEIDRTWDHLKAIRAAGFRAPKEHPDVQPANEALMLWEHYREAQRLPDAVARGNDLIEQFKAGETEAKEAERLLRVAPTNLPAGLRSQLNVAFDALANRCASCHRRNRDQ